MDKLCVSKFCVDKLCVSKCGQVVCGQVLCGQVMCGQVVWEEVVCVCCGGGQEEKAGHSGPSARPEPVQCHKCHACHAKWKSMSPSITPAT